MAQDQVTIAKEAIARTPLDNGGKTYSQQRRQSIAQLKSHDMTEKELEAEGEERDVRMKQVFLAGCYQITYCSYG